MISHTAQMTPMPRIAPVRVARMTSPDPMNSGHQMMEGPTSSSNDRPRGGEKLMQQLLKIKKSVQNQLHLYYAS
ncbi:MAG: hypothetical protein JXR41_01655 [Bacteroidales bacterium]|nr:hypothetical protein [Bacteroidales bacterium]MBN2761765.1 hypothetical protein [Bacteroidales bacterium]